MANQTDLQYFWNNLSDPGTLALIFIPLIVIWIGSYRSVQFYNQNRVALQLDENSDIVSKYAVILPVVGSIVLLLLFYFMDMIYYVFLGLLTFSSFTSLTYTITPVWDFLHTQVKKRVWAGIPLYFRTIDCIGLAHIPSVLAMLCSLALIITWFFTNSLILSDIFALCIGLFALTVLRIPSMKIAMAMLWAFFIYDVFWVFISPYVFGKNVMVTVARSVTQEHWNLPILITIPRLLADTPTMLGMGDIILPGIFISFLYRFDVRKTGLPSQGYFVNAMIGYAVGMVVTVLMLMILQMAQPALLYLVPGTMVPTWILGYVRGELSELWHGKPKQPASKQRRGDVEQGTPIQEEQEIEIVSATSPEEEYDIVNEEEEGSKDDIISTVDTILE